MAILAYDKDTNSFIPSKQLIITNYLWELRNTKNPWEVVAEVIRVWIKSNPKQWKSYVVRLKDIKESRKYTQVGTKYFRGVSREDKVYGGITSYVLDIPEWIIIVLRKLYNTSELSFDKEFFNEFGKRFPIFRIREKV